MDGGEVGRKQYFGNAGAGFEMYQGATESTVDFLMRRLCIVLES